MSIDRSNQVWALDTTYIPMAKGFVYLVAVVDWASRKVLAAKVAITLEAWHAVEVLQEAFNRHGSPEIVKTDQGSQFTAAEFVKAVEDRGWRFSMDGSGAWRDNVFVEQLWKSVKSERVYLHAYDSVNEEEVLLKVGLHFHARQARRGRREVKQLQTCLGRVYRDIVRKIEDQSIFQVTGFAISY